MNHTQGTWIAKELATYEQPGWVVLWSDRTKGGLNMRRLDSKGSFTEADARLIAAAPELLEALQLFMGSSQGFGNFTDKDISELAQEGNRLALIVQKARAAIAKATEES